MKYNKRLDQSGIAHLAAVLALVVVLAVGATGWYIYRTQATIDSSLGNAENVSQNPVIAPPYDGGAEIFGEKGEYGNFQAEGYAQATTVKEAACGMTPERDNCPDVSIVTFIITRTENQKALDYINSFGASEQGKAKLTIGCQKGATIEYYNEADEKRTQGVIGQELTAALLASSEAKPITLKLTKYELTFGKDASACYSHFATYEQVK